MANSFYNNMAAANRSGFDAYAAAVKRAKEDPKFQDMMNPFVGEGDEGYGTAYADNLFRYLRGNDIYVDPAYRDQVKRNLPYMQTVAEMNAANQGLDPNSGDNSFSDWFSNWVTGEGIDGSEQGGLGWTRPSSGTMKDLFGNMLEMQDQAWSGGLDNTGLTEYFKGLGKDDLQRYQAAYLRSQWSPYALNNRLDALQNFYDNMGYFTGGGQGDQSSWLDLMTQNGLW